MTPYFLYLIESSICLILFYLVYIMFLKEDTFHRFKRNFLLFSIFLSLLIPQMPSFKIAEDIEQTYIPQYVAVSDDTDYRDTFEKVVFGEIPTPQVDDVVPGSFSFISAIVLLYFMGILFLLYRLIHNLLHIYILIKRNVSKRYKGYYIISLPEESPSFSFFSFIFLNKNNINAEDQENVLSHEEAHIKQKHSLDILFIEIVKIVFWFNPVIWFLKRSLLKIHECLADQYSIRERSNNIFGYQSLLLKQYLSKIDIELAHSFNYSLIKFRIKMMTKKESVWWGKCKIAFALPVLVFGLFAFSNTRTAISQARVSDKDTLYRESEPSEMAFIPNGSFVLIRSNGETTRDFNVSLDAFWMKHTEVSILEYQVYLESLKKDSTRSVYEAALPNTTKAPFDNYFTDKKYENYPVVGVSLIQAQNFCIWKTKDENLKLKAKGKKPVYDYRIPTEFEWVYASFGGENPNKIEKPANLELTKVGSKKQNQWGLWNMFDNVSEWTNTSFEPLKYMTELNSNPNADDTKIIVVGNNYKNSLTSDKLIINGKESYDNVGFRYVRKYRIWKQ
jgi:formylglycine-generating enzyme required for sulfatase activity